MFVAFVVADADLIEPVDALFEHEEVGETIEARQVVAIAAGDDGLPVRFGTDRSIGARARRKFLCVSFVRM